MIQKIISMTATEDVFIVENREFAETITLVTPIDELTRRVYKHLAESIKNAMKETTPSPVSSDYF